MTLTEKTFENIYYMYSERLERFAERFVGDHKSAEDIVSEAFISLWEKYKSTDIDKFNSLIYRIVRNKCIDISRQKFIEGKISLDSHIPGEEQLYGMDFTGDSTDSPTLYHELASIVTKTFDRLPSQCRKVFIMSRVDGLKNREIASQIEISEKAVEKHISRALKAFRASIPDSVADSYPIHSLIVLILSGYILP